MLSSSVSCSVYTKPSRVDDYLYEVSYEKYDFTRLSGLADFLFHNKGKVPSAACSAVRKDSLFGRNFDWFYDEMPEFVIRVTSSEDRYASIGVASPIAVLKEKRMRSLRGSIVMDILPIFTVDGINENGVACCVNVVPQGDCGYATGTDEGGKPLCAPLIVRYILDNARSAEHAVALLSDRNIYTTFAYGLREDYHFMIADRDRTFVVELVDNRLSVLEDETVMTNFHLSKRGDTPHAMGRERYAILERLYDRIDSVEGMEEALDSVRYSRKYDPGQDPAWLSDLCSPNDPYGLVTSDITEHPDKFESPFAEEMEKYVNRDRTKGGTWHSVHTSVYCLPSRTLYLGTQESGVFRRFECSR